MEFFIMGFAMLIAKDHENSTLIAGAVICHSHASHPWATQEEGRLDYRLHPSTLDDRLCGGRASLELL